MTCYDCINRRRFARGSGLGWSSMFRLCWRHYMILQSRLHVARRVALACFAAALACFAAALIVFGVCGYVAKTWFDWRGMVGR